MEVPESLAGGARSLRLLDARDVAGEAQALLALANSGCLDPYPVVFSIGGAGGTGGAGVTTGQRNPWGSVDAACRAFADDLALGIVADSVQVTGVGKDPVVKALLNRIHLGTTRSGSAWTDSPDFWVRGFLVQALRSLNLAPDSLPEKGTRRRGAAATSLRRALGALASEAGCSVALASDVTPTESADESMADESLAEESVAEESLADQSLAEESMAAMPGGRRRSRIVALYLPQFHPIAENDRWWGPGFTEWTNVTAAKPVYRGHHQPKLPLDLGFYDLRLHEARAAQAELAQWGGLAGFMYYYYWFSGRRVLHRPIDEMINSGIDFPFCVMWANENWTRTWDGGANDVLLGQDYDKVPAEAFIDDVLPLLEDRRYLRISGRPLVSVYRPAQIPDFSSVAQEWRRRAAARGIQLHLVKVDTDPEYDGASGDPIEQGFDGVMGFPPHRFHQEPASARTLRVSRRFEGFLWSYAATAEEAERRLEGGLPRSYIPGVMVDFDNTARRQWGAHVWVGSNPYTFRRWLATAVTSVASRPEDERIVVVNAWNEWAEGAILEPSDRFGKSYLLAVRDVVARCGDE
jgi:hypothetical protein